MFCSTDFYYNDLPATNASTLMACMADCVAYVPTAPGDSGDQPCVAVTWAQTNVNGANCYLKSAIQDVVYGNNDLDSAKLVSYNPPPDVVVSVISSTTVGTTTAGTTTATSTATSTTTFSSYESPSPCPYANQTIIEVAGVDYQVQCGLDYEGNDLPSVNVDTFVNCMIACSNYVPTAPGDR